MMPRAREAFLLRMGGRTCAEIALLLGVSQQRVSQLCQSADETIERVARATERRLHPRGWDVDDFAAHQTWRRLATWQDREWVAPKTSWYVNAGERRAWQQLSEPRAAARRGRRPS